MFLNILKRRKKPPSERLLLAYHSACLWVYSNLDRRVKQWEKQPLQHRKWQAVICLAGLLLLGSFSVYYTATGHFFTRITQKHHEHQSNHAGAGSLRRK